MNEYKVLLLVLLSSVVCSSGFRRLYKHFFKYPSKNEWVGDPLFLTPFIKAGKIDYARAQAVVPSLQGKVQSYAGYLTVNEEYQSNMFFWFFPAEKSVEEAPVVLWLQGGPGGSSLFGLFVENGPYCIHRNDLCERNNSWTKDHSVLYIDNPVGTGYSFTRDRRGYVTNEDQVGRDLYKALTQFFSLFPRLQDNDFFVAGESYGGKYVPAIAYTIHESNPSAELKINLKGIAMGNGFSDPENQLDYGDYLYQLGLIDLHDRKRFHEKENQIKDMISRGEWIRASTELNDAIGLFERVTGLGNVYNYVKSAESDDGLSDLVQDARVRKSIHVGNSTWQDGKTVRDFLREDMLKSVRPWIEELLKAYRVLIYNGQLDVIVAYPMTENYLQKLNWTDKPVYDNATRSLWRVGDQVAGYVKVAGNLMEVMVRDAGHMVPKDQPEFAYQLIRHFTRNSPLA